MKFLWAAVRSSVLIGTGVTSISAQGADAPSTCTSAADRPQLVCEGSNCIRVSVRELCAALRDRNDGELGDAPLVPVKPPAASMTERSRRELARLIESLD